MSNQTIRSVNIIAVIRNLREACKNEELHKLQNQNSDCFFFFFLIILYLPPSYVSEMKAVENGARLIKRNSCLFNSLICQDSWKGLIVWKSFFAIGLKWRMKIMFGSSFIASAILFLERNLSPGHRCAMSNVQALYSDRGLYIFSVWCSLQMGLEFN